MIDRLERRSTRVKLAPMVTETRRTQRRADALSKARIVEAAFAILDDGGEAALTVRALAARLGTGSGAIYWHVADKDDLLAAATETVIARVTGGSGEGAGPRGAIRTLALGVFDAIDAHPWVGANLSREPWRPAMSRLSRRSAAACKRSACRNGRGSTPPPRS